MKFAKVYLIGFGLLSLAFGVGFLVAPVKMAEPIGFMSLSGSAITDIRVTHGGFQIGLGLFVLWAARAEDRFYSALWLALLSVGSVLVSRIAGVMLDGELSDFHISGLVVEFVLMTSAAIMLRAAKD